MKGPSRAAQALPTYPACHYFSAHLPCCAIFALSMRCPYLFCAPAVPLLLCAACYASVVPSCALIFLRTYPALPLFNFLRTPAVQLSRFSLTTKSTQLCPYPALRLPCCAIFPFSAYHLLRTLRALIFLRSAHLPCCALTLLCPYFSAQ